MSSLSVAASGFHVDAGRISSGRHRSKLPEPALARGLPMRSLNTTVPLATVPQLVTSVPLRWDAANMRCRVTTRSLNASV